MKKTELEKTGLWGYKTSDDFNWDTYTSSNYNNQVKTMDSKNQYTLPKFEDIGGELVFDDSPLHGNFKEIYRLTYELGVDSEFECGCGSTYNLINLGKILPNIKIGGYDYVQSQIDLGYEYFGLGDFKHKDNIKVKDMVDGSDFTELGRYEFVYTEAVVVHLMYTKAVKFLKNMDKISTKYIFLVENVKTHNFGDLIKEALPNYEIIENSKYIDYGILLKKNEKV